jgi:hypothetical protein
MIAGVAATACASVPARPLLDASGALVAALPAEARLSFEEELLTDGGRMLSISLRLAHSASRSMEGMRLLSCTGRIALGEGAARRSFPITPRGGKTALPAPFQLAWMGSSPDGSDKQPAYYEFEFSPAPTVADGPIDYEFSAVMELQGRQVTVSGRGRAQPGAWRGSAPPSERGTAARF